MSRSGLSGEIRFRVPLPIVIPFGALAVIALVTVGFAQVLLSVPKEAAVAIALVAAVNILGACAFIAARPRLSGTLAAELAIVVLYPVIIGIAIAQLGLTAEEATGHGEPAAAASGGSTIVAKGVAWETDQLAVESGGEATITIDNEDSVVHNLAVYETEKDASSPSKALERSPDVSAGQSIDFSFKAPEPGSYFFICDYHPSSMTGTLKVE